MGETGAGLDVGVRAGSGIGPLVAWPHESEKPAPVGSSWPQPGGDSGRLVPQPEQDLAPSWFS